MPGQSGDGPAGDTGEDLSLSKLGLLPWDEKTENGLLRSRLDEQSQLICLLKRRADETLQRCQALERISQELERKSEEAQSRLLAEKKRGDQLEERFNMLASNHQDMIRFKDEYKRQNEELRAECDLLRENRHPDLLEREKSIRELRAQLGERDRELQEERDGHQEELMALRRREEQLLGQIREQSLQVEELTGRIKDSEVVCHQAQEQLACLEEARRNEQNETAKKLDEAENEKQELLQLCMARGKTLQDRQKEAVELNNRLQEAEKACKEAEDKYRQDSAAVDANARVKELSRRLEEGEEEIEQLRREYEAYKKHVGDLLTKERELNAKLRHLIG
ncbi:coiled-coil domain-containing protein 89 [Discoglossus pictus]